MTTTQNNEDLQVTLDCQTDSPSSLQNQSFGSIWLVPRTAIPTEVRSAIWKIRKRTFWLRSLRQKDGFQKGSFGRCSSLPKLFLTGRYKKRERWYQKPGRGTKKRNDGTRKRDEGTFAKTILLQNRPFVSSRSKPREKPKSQISWKKSRIESRTGKVAPTQSLSLLLAKLILGPPSRGLHKTWLSIILGEQHIPVFCPAECPRDTRPVSRFIPTTWRLPTCCAKLSAPPPLNTGTVKPVVDGAGNATWLKH